ncbi:MAG: hypothetical protein ACI4PF_01545 [Christensenellales bacterium]
MKFKKNFKYNFNLINKKYWLILFLLFLAFICTLDNKVVLANETEVDYASEISQSVYDIVDGINFSEIENIISGLDTLNLFEGSVKEKVSQILSGEYFTNYSSLFSAIISIFFVDIRKILPLIFTLLAIGILSNLINEFKNDNASISDIVHFVCFSIMIITILFAFKDILKITSNTINLILKQMQVIFPLLITMLTSIGSLSSVSIYNPLVAVLTTIVSIVFEKFLYPIFIIMFIFAILGNLTSTIKLDQFQSFLGSTFKWVVGFIFTLFAGFLSIQGITAGKFDSVSIKATKFAIKSYVPIIGSYISDGMDFLVLGSVLVKNTIGLVGILILFLSIISPIITILVIKLALQLCSAILEMTCSAKMSNFLNTSSKLLVYPIVIILGISFMYIITIALIMCTANIF